MQSLPSRERGLKHREYASYCLSVLSLPSRERGLKHTTHSYRLASHIVAPFAGAWIETKCASAFPWIRVSLPSRERGLKLFTPKSTILKLRSLPSRERGLKHFCLHPLSKRSCVAPFAGAWIETSGCSGIPESLPSLPSRERGLKP